MGKHPVEIIATLTHGVGSTPQAVRNDLIVSGTYATKLLDAGYERIIIEYHIINRGHERHLDVACEEDGSVIVAGSLIANKLTAIHIQLIHTIGEAGDSLAESTLERAVIMDSAEAPRGILLVFVGLLGPLPSLSLLSEVGILNQHSHIGTGRCTRRECLEHHIVDICNLLGNTLGAERVVVENVVERAVHIHLIGLNGILKVSAKHVGRLIHHALNLLQSGFCHQNQVVISLLVLIDKSDVGLYLCTLGHEIIHCGACCSLLSVLAECILEGLICLEFICHNLYLVSIKACSLLQSLFIGDAISTAIQHKHHTMSLVKHGSLILFQRLTPDCSRSSLAIELPTDFSTTQFVVGNQCGAIVVIAYQCGVIAVCHLGLTWITSKDSAFLGHITYIGQLQTVLYSGISICPTNETSAAIGDL